MKKGLYEHVSTILMMDMMISLMTLCRLPWVKILAFIIRLVILPVYSVCVAVATESRSVHLVKLEYTAID